MPFFAITRKLRGYNLSHSPAPSFSLSLTLTLTLQQKNERRWKQWQKNFERPLDTRTKWEWISVCVRYVFEAFFRSENERINYVWFHFSVFACFCNSTNKILCRCIWYQAMIFVSHNRQTSKLLIWCGTGLDAMNYIHMNVFSDKRWLWRWRWAKAKSFHFWSKANVNVDGRALNMHRWINCVPYRQRATTAINILCVYKMVEIKHLNRHRKGGRLRQNEGYLKTGTFNIH